MNLILSQWRPIQSNYCSTAAATEQETKRQREDKKTHEITFHSSSPLIIRTQPSLRGRLHITFCRLIEPNRVDFIYIRQRDFHLDHLSK